MLSGTSCWFLQGYERLPKTQAAPRRATKAPPEFRTALRRGTKPPTETPTANCRGTMIHLLLQAAACKSSNSQFPNSIQSLLLPGKYPESNSGYSKCHCLIQLKNEPNLAKVPFAAVLNLEFQMKCFSPNN